MGRKKQFSTEDALDSAIGVLLAKGYEATAVADLVSATRLHPGSLYNAFGSKRDLLAMALQRFYDTSGFSTTLEDRSIPPRQAIEKIFTKLARPDPQAGRLQGCLISNTAMELGGADPEISGKVRDYFRRMEDCLCRLVEAGQQSGDITSSTPPRQLARFLLSTAQGMQLLAQVNPDPAMLGDVADAALACLGAPTEAPGRLAR